MQEKGDPCMLEIKTLLIQVASLANVEIKKNQIEVTDRGCPHIPKGLPQGKMGIYMFIYGDYFLKIGKAGSKSNARFISQHYKPNSAQSNLAKSILSDPLMQENNLDKENVGDWIKQNIRRIDLLIDSSVGIFVLDLFEAFLHCKYNPKYEGFENQR